MKISKKQLFGAALIAGLSLMSVNAAFAAEERQADRPREEAPKTETKTEGTKEGTKNDVRLTVEQYFVKFDKNADGFLVEGEIKAEQVKTWDKASKTEDGNVIAADGKVTLKEFKAGLAADEAKRNQEKLKLNAANKFKELDKNADGKIVADEINNAELFAKIDANKNAEITLEEMQAFMLQSKVKEQPKEGVREQSREGVKEQPKTGDRE